jgi:hypothetical protein
MFAFKHPLGYKKVETFLSSSMAEHAAVNRRVVGSSPTWGVFLFLPLVYAVVEAPLSALDGRFHLPQKSSSRRISEIPSFRPDFLKSIALKGFQGVRGRFLRQCAALT